MCVVRLKIYDLIQQHILKLHDPQTHSGVKSVWQGYFPVSVSSLYFKWEETF